VPAVAEVVDVLQIRHFSVGQTDLVVAAALKRTAGEHQEGQFVSLLGYETRGRKNGRGAGTARCS